MNSLPLSLVRGRTILCYSGCFSASQARLRCQPVIPHDSSTITPLAAWPAPCRSRPAGRRAYARAPRCDDDHTLAGHLTS